MKPGYKRTEAGVVPENWEVSPLGLLAVTSSGTTPARAMQERYYRNGSVAWVKTMDLTDSEVLTTSERVTEIALKETCLRVYPSGTVLVAMYGGFQQIGRTGLLRVPAAVNQAITAVQPNPDSVVPEFLQATLNHRVDYWKSVASSSRKDPNITSQDIRNFPIAYPTPAEQRAITAVLGDVGALLGALEQLVAKKRDLKQAAMQQLLTGQTRLPDFHGEWEVKRFGELAVPRRERVDPRKAEVQEFCIELEHIEQGSGRLTGSGSTGGESSLKSMFQAGDVLFGKLRAYLRKYWLADRSGVCSTEIWVLVANRSLISPEFLFQLVTANKFIDAASTAYGTHMPRSDWNVVKNYEVAVPKPIEQTAIAEALTDMDRELAALEERRAKTLALKQGIMQELLTGRTRLE